MTDTETTAIKMLEKSYFALDGINFSVLEKGEVYRLESDQAAGFISSGDAEEVSGNTPVNEIKEEPKEEPKDEAMSDASRVLKKGDDGFVEEVKFGDDISSLKSLLSDMKMKNEGLEKQLALLTEQDAQIVLKNSELKKENSELKAINEELSKSQSSELLPKDQGVAIESSVIDDAGKVKKRRGRPPKVSETEEAENNE